MDAFSRGVSSSPIVPGAYSLLAHKEVLRVVDIAEGAGLDGIEDLDSNSELELLCQMQLPSQMSFEYRKASVLEAPNPTRSRGGCSACHHSKFQALVSIDYKRYCSSGSKKPWSNLVEKDILPVAALRRKLL